MSYISCGQCLDARTRRGEEHCFSCIKTREKYIEDFARQQQQYLEAGKALKDAATNEEIIAAMRQLHEIFGGKPLKERLPLKK